MELSLKLAVLLLIMSSISAYPTAPIKVSTTSNNEEEGSNSLNDKISAEEAQGQLDHPAIIAEIMEATSRIRRQIGFSGFRYR